MLELLISILVIAGIGAVLALLLEIAHRYLADYGQCNINLNGQRDLEVTGGSPLLFSLMQEGVFMPSACGGRGTCSLCKLKVLEGGGPVLPTETPYLSPEEIDSGVRLSCQVKVRNDLNIEVPEELFLIREFKVTVSSIEEMTPQIKAVFLKITDDHEGLNFKPGQYVQLQLPRAKAKGEPEYRAYSICSSCAQPFDVELIITKVPDGMVSGYVHDELSQGDELAIVGPFGDFYYHEADRPCLLIATGSGLAPIRSILHHIEQNHITRKTVFFFGARSKSDLIYYNDMKELEGRLPNFTYIPTLSKPRDEDKWEGDVGRVTALVEKYLPELGDVDVYLCGSPPMVESCETALKQMGVPQAQIYYDKFTS